MKILSLDTTTMQGSIALNDGDRIVAQEQHGVRRTHSERLIASIAHLLEMAGWRREEIEGIAVAIGPGSFTGMRIGLATAKGMALALDVPIVGVSSLAALALNARGWEGTAVPLIDARRGELYAAAYRVASSGICDEVAEARVLPPQGVVEWLGALPGRLVLVGDGAAAYRGELQGALGERAVFPGGEDDLPRASHLAALAQERFARGACDDLAALVPDYIRRSDAEIGFGGGASKKKGD